MTPIGGAVACPQFRGRRLARCSGALSVDATALPGEQPLAWSISACFLRR
jgi:hypothetical protein